MHQNGPALARLRGPLLSAAALLLPLLSACAPRQDWAPARPQPEAESRPREAEPREPRRPTAFVAPGAVLAIPVRGIRPEQLRDSFRDARGGGTRTHNAIDIMAPAGTPVLAAADGTIFRLRTGGNGGITIYQLDPDGRTLYYYAHLQRYAAGLREGLPVVRGQVVAYVGDTGNAGPGNYHLHFSVSTLDDPRRWWEGRNTNPYPMLAGDAAYRYRSGSRAADSGNE
jgi:peptidoglycan LD-endopeptidase LytH